MPAPPERKFTNLIVVFFLIRKIKKILRQKQTWYSDKSEKVQSVDFSVNGREYVILVEYKNKPNMFSLPTISLCKDNGDRYLSQIEFKDGLFNIPIVETWGNKSYTYQRYRKFPYYGDWIDDVLTY